MYKRLATDLYLDIISYKRCQTLMSLSTPPGDASGSTISRWATLARLHTTFIHPHPYHHPSHPLRGPFPKYLLVQLECRDPTPPNHQHQSHVEKCARPQHKIYLQRQDHTRESFSYGVGLSHDIDVVVFVGG